MRQSEKYTQVVDAVPKHLPFDLEQHHRVDAQVTRLAEQAGLYPDSSEQV